MKPRNGTQISEILLILSKKPELQLLVFRLFLSMYLITMFRNLLIILVVSSDPRPHPHVLLPLQPVLCRHLCHLHHHPKDAVEHPDIEKNNSICTLYQPGVFFTVFAELDDFLLAVMAYACFVTICHPLHYTVIMNPQFCGLLVLVS